MKKIFEVILIMICEYRARGVFNVTNIGIDKAFESIKSELEYKPYMVILTTCNVDCHVEVIERMIIFVKERICVVRLAMLSKTIPKRFIFDVVHHVIIRVNSLYWKRDLGTVLSPMNMQPEHFTQYFEQ